EAGGKCVDIEGNEYHLFGETILLTNGVTTQVGNCRDCSNQHVPTQLDIREMQEFCSERFVHIRDYFRFRPGVAIQINVFPAHEKISVSPVDIAQVFIQAFCVWISGASYL